MNSTRGAVAAGAAAGSSCMEALAAQPLDFSPRAAQSRKTAHDHGRGPGAGMLGPVP